MATNEKITRGAQDEIVGGGDQPAARQRSKSWYAAILVALVIMVGLVSLFFMSHGKFKSVTYNNGHSLRFSMTFYRQQYSSTSYSSTTPATTKQTNDIHQSSIIGLASKTSLNNRYPLWLAISNNELTPYIRNLYIAYKGNLCSPQPTLFTVSNKNFKQHIPFCKFSLITDRQAYVGYFLYKQKLYTIIVTQVASKKQLADSNSKDSVGLADYQTDIKTIVSSLKSL
jgi:hypothetical protein